MKTPAFFKYVAAIILLVIFAFGVSYVINQENSKEQLRTSADKRQYAHFADSVVNASNAIIKARGDSIAFSYQRIAVYNDSVMQAQVHISVNNNQIKQIVKHNHEKITTIKHYTDSSLYQFFANKYGKSGHDTTAQKY